MDDEISKRIDEVLRETMLNTGDNAMPEWLEFVRRKPVPTLVEAFRFVLDEAVKRCDSKLIDEYLNNNNEKTAVP